MGWLKDVFRDREFEKYSREETYFEKAEPHIRVIMRMRQNTEALHSELKGIRVTLLGIFILLLILTGTYAKWW